MSLVRVVELHTTEGTLSVELYDREAPLLCETFVRLAESGQLNGPLFRQMIPGFAVIGNAYRCRESDTVYGVLTNTRETAPLTSSALHHVGAGLITCVMEEGAVATARFLLTLGPQPLLDRQYTIFGRLYSGLSVLTRLSKMQTDSDGTLFSPVVVQRCNIVSLPAVVPPKVAAVSRTADAHNHINKGKLLSSLDD